MTIRKDETWEHKMRIQKGVRVKYLQSPMNLTQSDESYRSKLEKVKVAKRESSWKWSPTNLPKIDILLVILLSLQQGCMCLLPFF
jgi:hypothetical protein